MTHRALTINQVQKLAKKTYRENGRSWTKAARAMGVSRGTLIRVAQGYEPKTASIRRALGMNVYVSIPTCPKCGHIHDQIKACERKPRVAAAKCATFREVYQRASESIYSRY